MIDDIGIQMTNFQPLNALQSLAFMAEVERRLSRLSDERAVLKGFADFPDKKLEVLRDVVSKTRELERCVGAGNVN